MSAMDAGRVRTQKGIVLCLFAFVAAALALWCPAGVSRAATTYYVDYEGGDNTADGLSPETAWKHSPGDENATNTPGSVELAPGDTVIFKGGVAYYGSIHLDVSGEPGNPITLDGNTHGEFGEGRAVIDGGRVIDGWERCESQEQAGGNPRWEDMFYADIDVDLSSNFTHSSVVRGRLQRVSMQVPWQRMSLFDGDGILPVAQDPKPSDPFYQQHTADFYETPHELTDSYSHELYYEEGTIGNPDLPLLPITHSGGAPPVIEPTDGGAVSIELEEPETISAIGVVLRVRSTPVEHVVFLADDEEIIKVAPDNDDGNMQRFELPEPVRADKLTFRLLQSDPDAGRWTRVGQFAAFNEDGDNVIEQDLSSIIRDEERLAGREPDHFDGMFVGFGAGNQEVYYAVIDQYDPDAGKLYFAHYGGRTYRQTRYAFFNSPGLIEKPGEWSIQLLEDGRSRIHLLPETLEDGRPVNIAFPDYPTGISVGGGASHLRVNGFLIQRFGGNGGVLIGRGAADIGIADCEIRFVSGSAGIRASDVDGLVVDNCHIHHNPGWTAGIFWNRVHNFRISRSRLDKNTGSGIRFYECTSGVIQDNVLLNHRGQHATSINLYEGCANVMVERNHIYRSRINPLTINRNAENIVIRHNIFDAAGEAGVCVGMWVTGRRGGRSLRNIHFLNNTFVNTNPDSALSVGIFCQEHGSPGSPEGLVIRENILDGLLGDLPGLIENNVYTRNRVAGRFLSDNCRIVTDLDALFIDPDGGDYRLREGVEAGADLSPPETMEFPVVADGEAERDVVLERAMADIENSVAEYEARVPAAIEEAEERMQAQRHAGRETAERRTAERATDAGNYEVPEDTVVMIQAPDFSDQGGGEVNVTADKVNTVGDSFSHWDHAGHWLEWTFDVPAEGYYHLAVLYCTASDRVRREIKVNSRPIDDYLQPVFHDTGGWANRADRWQLFIVDNPIAGRPLLIKLDEGENVLRMTNVCGRGMNLDYLAVFSPDVQPTRRMLAAMLRP